MIASSDISIWSIWLWFVQCNCHFDNGIVIRQYYCHIDNSIVILTRVLSFDNSIVKMTMVLSKMTTPLSKWQWHCLKVTYIAYCCEWWRNPILGIHRNHSGSLESSGNHWNRSVSSKSYPRKPPEPFGLLANPSESSKITRNHLKSSGIPRNPLESVPSQTTTNAPNTPNGL